MATASSLKVICWNIACSGRDEQKNPLSTRIQVIADRIRDLAPDVLFLLEAGRKSGDLTWDQMADLIAVTSGLQYQGCRYMNGGPNSFAKAIFTRTDRVIPRTIFQEWVSETPEVPYSGRGSGADVVSITISPIENPDSVFHLAATHFTPLDLESRLIYSRFVAARRYDLIMGDFNTFPDSGGPEMLSILNASYAESLPADTAYTFSAFAHDTITISEDLMPFHPNSEVISSQDTTITLRPKSWLDHSMVHRASDLVGKVQTVVAPEFDYDSSDHAPIVTVISL